MRNSTTCQAILASHSANFRSGLRVSMLRSTFIVVVIMDSKVRSIVCLRARMEFAATLLLMKLSIECQRQHPLNGACSRWFYFGRSRSHLEYCFKTETSSNCYDRFKTIIDRVAPGLSAEPHLHYKLGFGDCSHDGLSTGFVAIKVLRRRKWISLECH